MTNEIEVTELNPVETLIKQNGLEVETAKSLHDSFMPFFEQAEDWKKKAESIVVTSIEQTREMQMARQARLALKDIRVDVEKTRIRLKEDIVRKGKAIDGIANVIKYLIEPIEGHLKQQEDFIKVQESKRIAELKEERTKLIQPFLQDCETDTSYYDLGNMPEQTFNNLLKTLELGYNERIATQQRIEAERIAKEKAEAEERERIRIENERLKKEALEKEKQLAEERAKAEAEKKAIEEKARKAKAEADAKAKKLIAEQDAKLKKEREEKEKLEAELKAKEEQEKALLKAQKEAEKKAKAAPDKTKLTLLADTIINIQLPEVSSEEAKEIISNVKNLLNKIKIYINEQTQKF